MRRRILAGIAFALLLTVCSSVAPAADDNDKDTDTRLVRVRVVEVGERRISVIARSEVEHVIAVDREGTKVRMGDRVVSLKDLRQGDVVTVELDEANPVKFARDILIGARQSEQAARKH